MELGPNGEDFPPYEERKKIIFTFLLCWKHSKMASFSKIPRDILKIILDWIPVDLTHSFEYKGIKWKLLYATWVPWSNEKYGWELSDNLASKYSCCPKCLRPPTKGSCIFNKTSQLICILHGQFIPRDYVYHFNTKLYKIDPNSKN